MTIKTDAEILDWLERNHTLHSYIPFGTEQPRWRCGNCNKLQPLEEASTALAA